MGNIRKLVLDVLKPHEPDLVQYSEKLSYIRDAKGASIFLNEVDEETKSDKMIVEGSWLNYDSIIKANEEMAGSIDSIHEIYAGGTIVDDVDTPLDR